MVHPSQSILSIILGQQMTFRIATCVPRLQRPLLGKAWRRRTCGHSRFPVTTIFQQTKCIHSTCHMAEGQRYRRLRLGLEDDLENAFQTLLLFIKNPALAGQLRHLEVHGSRYIAYGRDLDFNIPPEEPQQLGLDDLDRLKMAINKAGFTESNEPQRLLNILLQNPTGRDLYVVFLFFLFPYFLLSCLTSE